jgi:hypothetical protein
MYTPLNLLLFILKLQNFSIGITVHIMIRDVVANSPRYNNALVYKNVLVYLTVKLTKCIPTVLDRVRVKEH